jgi:D-alanyl-D-alanine carboxypeptidase (penicillin-binding protein 5/6)
MKPLMKLNSSFVSAVILLLLPLACGVPAAAALEIKCKSPYTGAIVVDAVTGKVLFEDHADAKGYPASVTKLMVLFVMLEAVESRHLELNEPVTVTAEAARIGGSQVYLKEGEVFSVDELLYALIVQSANDAATALAIHYAGSKEALVALMNRRARELGMRATVFHSVHGLPPGRRQLPDVSTARDIATLCRELVKKPHVLKYTSTQVRPFRTDAAEPFIMRSHNPLLRNMKGCDGLKTGFFNAAGWSIAATASKHGQRAIAVVLGAAEQRVRDAKTKKILSEGLMQLMTSPSAPVPAPASDTIEIKKSTLKSIGAGVGGVLLLGFVLFAVRNRARERA